jgi:hypothetical protein
LDHLLDVRIGPGLVKLMIKCRNHALPWRVEDWDAVCLPIGPFRVHPCGIVNRRAINLD